MKEAPYALLQLIDSFPQIFTRDLVNEIKPAVHLLEEYGVPREKLGRVILCFPPLLLKDVTAELRPRMKELKKVLLHTFSASMDWKAMVHVSAFLFTENISCCKSCGFLPPEILVDAGGRCFLHMHLSISYISAISRRSVWLHETMGE